MNLHTRMQSVAVTLERKKLKSLQRRVRTTLHINITQLKLCKNKKKVIVGLLCDTSPLCQCVVWRIVRENLFGASAVGRWKNL